MEEDERRLAMAEANMQKMLDKKLASKSMKAETAVLSEEQEARYFFSQLQKIRSKDEEKQST